MAQTTKRMITKMKTAMTMTRIMKMKTMATMTITYVFYFIELGKFQLSEEKVQDEEYVYLNAATMALNKKKTTTMIAMMTVRLDLTLPLMCTILLSLASSSSGRRRWSMMIRFIPRQRQWHKPRRER